MEIVDGVHRFGTGMVNWYLIERDGRLTLVDAGMRGYWRQLERALRDLGRKVEEVEAVVLTHAHADHIGFAHQVKANSDATVWVHERDVEPGLRRFPPMHLYLRAHGLAAAGPRPAQRAADHPGGRRRPHLHRRPAPGRPRPAAGPPPPRPHPRQLCPAPA